MSVNTALIRFVYPGRLQGQGFGYNALVVATAFTIGPTIASGILASGPWTWLFAINIPFGVVAVLIGLNTLPRTPSAAHAFDFTGARMAASCLGRFILGIGSAAHHEQPGLISIELASAVLLGWTLIRRQSESPAPVLPIDLFRRPIFAAAGSRGSDYHGIRNVSALMMAAMFGRADVVKLLLVNGANRDLRDKVGNTAVSLAQQQANPQMIALLTQAAKGQ
jgi:hypothetical protein